MPPRNQQRSCHNCPLPTPPAAPPTRQAALVAAPPPQRYDVPVEDGLKLWRHVLFGTNTCIDMIDGYAKLGMPGDPIKGVQHLRDRLNEIIHHLEGRNDAPDSSSQ